MQNIKLSAESLLDLLVCFKSLGASLEALSVSAAAAELLNEACCDEL